MDFLNADSPFMADLRKLIDFIALGLLWVIASVPIFTFGAATTAAYYTAENVVHTHSGGVWKTFWQTFRKEFKQATLLWLVGLLLTVMLALNGLLLWKVALNSVIYAVLLATVVLGVGWMMLWYGYLSRFEDTNRILLVNTFRITLINIPRLLLMVVIIAAAVAVAVYAFLVVFPVVILIPGIYISLSNMVMRGVFKPYIAQQALANTDEA